MKKNLLLCLLVASIPFTKALAQAGSLDPTFGNMGRVVTTLGNNLYDIVLQEDGKIVAAGIGNVLSSEAFRIARYLNNGLPDTDFGIGGRVSTLIGAKCGAGAVALQADGKIVVAGYTSDTVGNSGNFDFMIVRYNTDGSLDTSFNLTGIVTIPLPGGDFASVVQIQSDGKILVGGAKSDDFALVRLLSDGAIDPGFNPTGYIGLDASSYGGITAMKVLTDDSVIVVGRIRNVINIAKYTSNGVLDETFGNEGQVVLNAIEGITYVPGMVVLENGDFILAGGLYTEQLGKYNGLLVKLSANGSLVESFGTNGVLINDLGGRIACHGRKIAVSRDKLVVSYSSGLGSNYDFNVSVYDMNGVPDTTFGNGGSAIFDFGSQTHDYLEAMLIQPDDKIMLGGKTGAGGFTLARLMPVGVTAGTDNFTEARNKFMVYPNPAVQNSKLLVDLKEGGVVTLKLYDVKGALMATLAENKTFPAGKTEVPLGMDNLAKGVYFLNITSINGKGKTLRVVK
jgi:uncharacterized delta-60 repeat protein